MSLLKKFFGYDFGDVTAENMSQIAQTSIKNEEKRLYREGDKYFEIILREIENQAKHGNNMLNTVWKFSEDIITDLKNRGFKVQENIKMKYEDEDENGEVITKICYGTRIKW